MTGERTRLACGWLRLAANLFLPTKYTRVVDEAVGRNTRGRVWSPEGNSANESGAEKSLPAFA
jgi:hypothetical protein